MTRLFKRAVSYPVLSYRMTEGIHRYHGAKVFNKRKLTGKGDERTAVKHRRVFSQHVLYNGKEKKLSFLNLSLGTQAHFIASL